MSGAFQACFTDLRLVKGRKCVQLVFEVPVEQADKALEILGGMPDPSKSAWCGIARISPEGVTAREPTANRVESEVSIDSPGSPELGRGTSRLIQKVAMCCQDPVFQKFLNEHVGPTYSEADAAKVVRTSCGVSSRSQIIPGTLAAKRWDDIYGKFLAWREAA